MNQPGQPSILNIATLGNVSLFTYGGVVYGDFMDRADVELGCTLLDQAQQTAGVVIKLKGE